MASPSSCLNPYDTTKGTGIDPATQVVYPGEQIFIPNPDLKLPTPTPIRRTWPEARWSTIWCSLVIPGGDHVGIQQLRGRYRQAE